MKPTQEDRRIAEAVFAAAEQQAAADLAAGRDLSGDGRRG